MACRSDSGKIVRAGVDWLTTTTTTPASSETLWKFAVQSLTVGLPEGEHPARWHAHGYEGWSVEGLSFGARSDGVLVRLSGQKACNEWRAALAAADNVTRLDLAVDLEFQAPMPALARNLYRDTGHKSSRNGRPFNRSLVISSDGGTTCYLGSRSSDYFGRCYDKGVEQKAASPGKLWRYELEVKGDPAFQFASQLATTEDERAKLVATTMEWFRSRGARVQLSWIPFNTCSVKLADATPSKRIQWLARCVRPTAVELSDELGRERVLGILGLLPTKPQLASPTLPQETTCH
jgi:DNA relaxase NicK